MEQWLLRQNLYLHHIVDQERPPEDMQCGVCQDDKGSIRCMNCRAAYLVCPRCCITIHKAHPFHVLQKWTGSFFDDYSLYSAGFVLSLGHGGDACQVIRGATPQESNADAPFDHREHVDNADFSDDGDPADENTVVAVEDTPPEELPTREPVGPRVTMPDVLKGDRTMTVVDRSGVHQHSIRWCRCPEAAEDDIQLLRAGLYPASFKRPRTVFTFDVLDDFAIDTVECKTAALNYFNKLCRITNNAAPKSVPVCYCMFLHRVSY